MNNPLVFPSVRKEVPTTKRKLILSFLLTGLFLFVSTFGLGMTSFAAESDFSAEPVVPDNQIGETTGYFDLKVEPNAHQTLKMKVRNLSDKKQRYAIHINTATTNANGIVDYSMADFPRDDSMSYSLKDYVKAPEEPVEIDANGEQEVSLELTVPEGAFDGMMLGGIVIAPVQEETKKEGITNVFTRTLAIVLHETDTPVTPDILAGKVILTQENLRNNIGLELRNPTSALMKELHAEIDVQSRKNGKSVFKEKKDDLSFAPNSKFTLTSMWGDNFEPGEYDYLITITDANKKEWKFKEGFTVTKKEAEKLNETSVDKPKASIPYLLIGIIAFLVLLLVIGVILFVRMKKANANKE